MKKALLAFAMLVLCAPTFAQRFTDNLDRGLVAVQPRKGTGLFLSWRIQAEEYYGVTYNLYRNGTKLNETPLSVSNYLDTGGSLSDTYTVRAVVNGVEQADSKSAKMFTTGMEVPKNYSGQPGYWYIRMKDVVDRNGNVVYSTDGNTCAWNYSINDISMADLDGDGEIEFIVKRINETDGATAYPDGTTKEMYEYGATAFTIIEAYKMDGTRLWWIDCGPNMVSMNCVEINAVAYDWDEDGKAEVVMRGADNMIIHKSDGSTYNVGNMSANTRNEIVSHTNAQYAWTHSGAEYLLYLNGTTGAPYQVIDFPLKRFEDDEVGMTDKQVWSPNNSNGGYGHRSSKYFFGAPFLDGRHASIWLGRGIYTQTKMCALDVDRNTHQLTQRWYWRNKTVGSSWFGQGNHNMSIADVDGDGCDEIIYGSMVIDHNGKGLSTTGLGHGDAIHVSDLDPFRKGLEVFACNEEQPANNLRDATTSEILYRSVSSSDDGRAIMGNFTNDYPGCTGRSVSSGVISAASHSVITDYEKADDYINWGWLNGRIYWDGDLCEEYVNGTNGNNNTDLTISKVGTGRVMQTVNTMTINDTKKNLNAQGDIIGDWREEVIMRSNDNKEIRIYSTDQTTQYRIPSLWYDHEYRQAMVWQVCGYNQPPHASFFLGELEGITKAPVPLTNRGRTELQTNSSITSAQNGTTVMLCDAGNYGIDANGASPSLLVVNVPSSVTGNDNNNNITRTYKQTQLGVTLNGTDQKGDLSGAMNFVKQGDGLLKLTARTFSYTGSTEIWEGSLYFRGGWANSDVWMNRHTNFYCGANIQHSLTMEYGSTLYPSKDAADATTLDYNTVKVGTLNMHEGARIVFQISAEKSDQIEIGTLNIRKKNWNYGPQYDAPVFEIQSNFSLTVGRYKLGTVTSVGSGSLEDIVVECKNSSARYSHLEVTDGTLELVLSNQASNGSELLGNNTLADGTTNWTFTATGGNWSGVVGSNPSVVEAYSGWEALKLTDFQMSQSVTLDPGQYKLTGYGFYRYGVAYNTDASISRAVMFAGSASVPVVTLGSISQNSYANSTTDASAAFADGLYQNVLSFEVGTTTTIDIGFRGTHDLKQSWFIAGPMSLIKVSDVSGATVAYPEVFRLDFEEESTDNYGFQGNCAFSQFTKSDGTHCIHVDQAGGAGDRTANLHLHELSPEFALATDYIFEFDWGHSVSNQNESETTLKCDDYATLFYIKTPSYGVSTLYNASNESIATLTNDGYSKACPTKLSHFKITSNSNGTYLTVTYDGTTVVNNYKLADGLKHITALDNKLGRAVSHMVLDDLVLQSKKVTATLSDTQKPVLESGMYNTLTIKRSLKAGINSFCVPFQTTPEEVAGLGAKAWAFDRVQNMSNNTDRFYFTQVETIEPNVPYLLDVPVAMSVPSFNNIQLTAPTAGYVERSGWRFVCNYVPETVLTEQNYVIKNGYLAPCAYGALINGMRAYFVAPSDASSSSNRTLTVCFDEETGIESAVAVSSSEESVFDVNGMRQCELRQGIYIVRSGNGSVRKVIVK